MIKSSVIWIQNQQHRNHIKVMVSALWSIAPAKPTCTKKKFQQTRTCPQLIYPFFFLLFRLWFGIIDFHFFFHPLLVLFPYLSVRFGSITSSPAAFWHRCSAAVSSPTSETLTCCGGTLFRGTTSMLPSLWEQRKQSYETNFPTGMLKAVLWDSNVN